MRKVSDILFEIDCGRNSKPQIIHCDRIKKKISQRLRGEDTGPEQVDIEDSDDMIEEQIGLDDNIDLHSPESDRPRRVIKRPGRYKDFVCEFQNE